MATNLPSCFFIQFLEQLLKFLVNFTLLKYVKSQKSYGFLITKELIFGFQILDLIDHFSASMKIAGPSFSLRLFPWIVTGMFIKVWDAARRERKFVSVANLNELEEKGASYIFTFLVSNWTYRFEHKQATNTI